MVALTAFFLAFAGPACGPQPGPAPTPTPDTRAARQALADVNTGLDAYSEDTVNALAAERGLQPGSRVAGQGDASGLQGSWTSTLSDQGGAKSQTAELQFDNAGRLEQLTLYGEDLVQTTLDFQGGGTTGKAGRRGKVEVVTRAVAAEVYTENGVDFTLDALALVDRTDERGTRRTLEFFEITFSLVRQELRFTGLLHLSFEIIGTTVPDEQVGTVVEQQAQAEAFQNEPPVADAGSDIVLLDLEGDGIESVQLDGSASFDTDGEIVAYEWYVDGEFVAAEPSPIVDFTRGDHYVELLVADNEDGIDIAAIFVTVEVWQTTAVPVDPTVSGQTSLVVAGDWPSLTYWNYAQEAIQYAVFDEAGVQVTTVDATSTGGWNSLTDLDGTPAAAYFSNGELRYAEFIDGVWQSITLAAGVTTLAMPSLAKVGGQPAISFFEELGPDTGQLKHIYYDGAEFVTEIVDDSGDAGLSSSVAEIGGQPAIAYVDDLNSLLVYARFDGSAWQYAEIDSTYFTGAKQVSMAEINGQPAISYYRAETDSLHYAAFDPLANAWTTTQVDFGGSENSLAVVNGYPGISYVDAQAGVLKYAWFDSAGWQTATVFDQGVAAGYGNSLADWFGRPTITHFDIETGDLYLTTLAP